MRIVSWNILHGGSKRRLPHIIESLKATKADVLVITEAQNSESGVTLKAALTDQGFTIVGPLAEPKINSVLIASRRPVSDVHTLSEQLPYPGNLLCVCIEGVKLCGVYFPLDKWKIPYWKTVIDAVTHTDIVIGDFNTGANDLDKSPAGMNYIGAEYMHRMSEAGYIDLWRVSHPTDREYTWYSSIGNGFRIDHAFGTQAISQAVRDIRYSHVEREQKISDHSMLMLEIDLSRLSEQRQPAGVQST